MMDMIERELCGTYTAQKNDAWHKILRICGQAVKLEVKRLLAIENLDCADPTPEDIASAFNLTCNLMDDAVDETCNWAPDRPTYQDIWTRQLADKLARNLRVLDWRDQTNLYWSGTFESHFHGLDTTDQLEYIRYTLTALHIIFYAKQYVDICETAGDLYVKSTVFKQ